MSEKIKKTAFFKTGLSFLAAVFFCLCQVFPAAAQETSARAFRPLTQADIDGYVYLLPRLGHRLDLGAEEAARVLRDSGLSRRRAAYVGSKLAITQAVATGLLSTSQMRKDEVPLYLQPSTEELALVKKNLDSIIQAQELARRAEASKESPADGRGR